MTELAQKAVNRLLELDDYQQDILAERLLEMIDSEAYLDDDDEEGLEESLGRFVFEDGSINLEALNENAITLTLDELYNEGEDQSV